MEIADKRIANGEIIRGEDKLVGPPLERHDMAVHADRSGNRSEHGSTHGTDILTIIFGFIDNLHQFLIDKHLLAIHAMLRQILHIDILEVPPSAVQRQKSSFNTLDLKTFQ